MRESCSSCVKLLISHCERHRGKELLLSAGAKAVLPPRFLGQTQCWCEPLSPYRLELCAHQFLSCGGLERQSPWWFQPTQPFQSSI